MTQSNSSGPSGPTWYDILGVTPDATPEQVKAAWRDATDKFEPGTGASQFRLFNEAADTLLDPEKRAAYDAGLGLVATRPTPVELEKPAAPASTLVPTPEPVPDTVEPTPAPEPTGPEPTSAPEPVEGRTGYPVGVWVTAVLAVLAVISLVVAGVFAVRLEHRVNTRKDDAAASSEASAVASRALTAVLSYDYRHMEADRDRSAKFLTPKYRKEFLKTFDLLTQGPNGSPGGAVKTKAVVTATVLNTAVQDVSADKVRVLVFVNQSSVKGSGTPSIFQNRVVATLVRSGGSWLIDDVQSY